MDVFCYQIGDNLYINLTNRCTNDCVFCERTPNATYEGYPMWLSHEPTAEEVLAAAGDISKYREVVFCGLGEPTLCLPVLLEVAKEIKARGGFVRLNTNGHANAFYHRDVSKELASCVDLVSISLNADNPVDYDHICRPSIPGGFDEMLAFARACVARGIRVRMSVVDVIGEKAQEHCRSIAEEIGAEFFVRELY